MEKNFTKINFHDSPNSENNFLIISVTFSCSAEIYADENADPNLTVMNLTSSTSKTESKRGMVLVGDETASTSTSTNITSDAQRENAHSGIPTECSRIQTEEDEEETAEPNTMEGVCVFCKQKQRMHKRRFVPMSATKSELTIKLIQGIATKLDDADFLKQIEVILAMRGSLLYHNFCKNQYQAKLRVQERAAKEPTDYTKNRNMHATAMDYVYGHVEEHVIQGERPLLTDTLHFIYKTRIEDEFKHRDLNINVNFDNRNLEQNLLSHFKGKIVLDHRGNRKFVKPINSTVKINLAELEEDAEIERIGIIIRYHIDSIKARKLGDVITVQNLIEGECDIPPKLLLLIRSIATDPLSRREISPRKQRQIKSVSNDIIYITTNGKLKTSKHITYGLAIKGLSNSKKLITMANEYGHCCSYTTLEELETEATISSKSFSDICPSDIIRQPNLNTGLAFDNYDRYVIQE